jgi:hypothetical protein
MEKNQVFIPIEAEFHMLRHFEQCSAQSLDRIRVQYSQEQIAAEMAQVGSRFYKIFATDIPSILDNVFAGVFNQKTGNNGNVILSLQADIQVGEHGVAKMDKLTQVQKDKITFKNNRGLDLMHLQVDQLPPTNAYVLILKPIENGYNFITAFPGDEGMPLPYETLSEDYRKICKAYWDEHVFLDKK